MSKNRELKEKKVEEISEKLKEAKSAVLLDYRGLNVDQATKLRKIFRENNVEYRVYKNRLVKLAIKDTDFEALESDLTGPNGIAFSTESEVMPAKLAKEFSKDNPKLELKSGVVNGVFYDNAGISKLADIPRREVLIAKFMGSIKSPVNKFAYLLKAIAEKNESVEQ